jgi:hypothetical protein
MIAKRVAFVKVNEAAITIDECLVVVDANSMCISLKIGKLVVLAVHGAHKRGPQIPFIE